MRNGIFIVLAPNQKKANAPTNFFLKLFILKAEVASGYKI